MGKLLAPSSIVLLLAFLLQTAKGHDKYLGKCPDFKPMKDFNWDKFAGRWYAVEKFDTSSRCLTYDFDEDEMGERSIVQTSEINTLKKLTVNNKVKYTGKLTFPRSTQQADMIVKFPLSVLGSAEYVVMDSDYENYAMLCTCQSSKFLFEIFTWHRRSCTILQRESQRNTAFTDKMHALLNREVGADPSDSQQPDHDFDVITHDARCNYQDNGKGLNIDVDKILKSTKDEIVDTVFATVEEIDETLFKKFGNKNGEAKEDDEREETTYKPNFEPIVDTNFRKQENYPRV